MRAVKITRLIRNLKAAGTAIVLSAYPGFSETMPLPSRAIPMDCRLVNMVRNAGSANEPREEFWTIVEFEGRTNLNDKIDFSAAQPFALGGYTWVDATGVADIRIGDETIRLMNKVRVFRADGTDDYFIGLPDLNEILVTVHGVGLGIEHVDRSQYDLSIMYEPPSCHLIP